MREYVAPDGVRWTVEVRTPGASNAMIVFHHPDDATSRRNRYAWHIWRGDEARNVTARLAPERVLEALGDADLAMLFRRSMPIQTEVPPPVPASAGAPAWGLGSVEL